MLALLQRLRRGARARGGYFFKIRRLESFPRELFVLTRTGLFQCWGMPRWARPPAACRVSELERSQCNCALGPFLCAALPPDERRDRASITGSTVWANSSAALTWIARPREPARLRS